MKIEVNESKESILILSLLALGINKALEQKVISFNLAEGLLFCPYVIKLCQDLNLSKRLVNIIHEGTELEDISSLVGEDSLRKSLESINKQLLKVIADNDTIDFQADKILKPIDM